jgi:shikimate kinase
VTDSIRCVALFGGPGSGKRSVGESLAKRLEWAFVDFDTALEELEEQPVPHLLESLSGESARRLTLRVLEEVIAPRPSVVAFSIEQLVRSRACATDGVEGE